MSSTTSHRKSRSISSSIFGRSSLSRSPAPSSPDTSSTPNSPSKRLSSAASRLSCLLIPQNKNYNEGVEITAEALPRRPSSGYALSESPGYSPTVPPSPSGQRPSLSRRGGRPNSIFGSLKSLRFAEDTLPGSLSSENGIRRNGSFKGREWLSREEYIDIGRNRTILYHGEVQTNSGLFWKRREYVVLTETHLVRFKSQSSALELFHTLPLSCGRAGIVRHGSSPSVEVDCNEHSFISDPSNDKATALPLEYVVAILQSDEGRNPANLEVLYLDKETSQGLSITLSLADPASLDAWSKKLRRATDTIRLLDMDPIPAKLSEYAALAVEREHDYDPARFKIYKVAKHASVRGGGRTSTDDTRRLIPSVGFLAIGIDKVHIISLPKAVTRQSSPLLSDLSSAESFSVLIMTWVSTNESDDSLNLEFRKPLQPAQSVQLSSLAAPEIAVRLRQRYEALCPQWRQLPFAFLVPSKIEDDYFPDNMSIRQDHNGFERTLTAFCSAYNVNPSSIRYMIQYDVEDAPRFELLAPLSSKLPSYNVLELLAVLRALRYNESFGSLSFAGINLDVLNNYHDLHGLAILPSSSPYGSPTSPALESQPETTLLVQEIRALAAASKRLRRLDFSSCFGSSSQYLHARDRAVARTGILEALAPLCRAQLTNVDWLVLSGIQLHQADVALVINMGADKRCHLRAIELNSCGLNEDSTALVLDAFRAQVNTLEVLDLSSNEYCINPSTFPAFLSDHCFIRRLDLSHLKVKSGEEAILPFHILSAWRLERLGLNGIPLNDESVEAICQYLSHTRSSLLIDLDLGKCSLDGAHVERIMRSMTKNSERPRQLHLDVSDNRLVQHFNGILEAIKQNLAPSHLNMSKIELDEDDAFRALLSALAMNCSIRQLDISSISLPEGASEDTCQALRRLLAENHTLEELDISGEQSRLVTSRLGSGIRGALSGLELNDTLQILRVRHQQLGIQGAAILADVFKTNTCLRELYCDGNEITLPGFTDLVNALSTNTTMQRLPSLEDDKFAAIAQTKKHIKDARAIEAPSSSDLSRFMSVRRTTGRGNTGGNRIGTSRRTVSLQEWTDVDAKAALRLVSDGWETQCNRLNRFLDRNLRIASGVSFEEAEILAGIREKPVDVGEAIPGVVASLHDIWKPSAPPSLEPDFEEADGSSPRFQGAAGTVPVLERGVFDFEDVENHGIIKGVGLGLRLSGSSSGADDGVDVGGEVDIGGLQLKIPKSKDLSKVTG